MAIDDLLEGLAPVESNGKPKRNRTARVVRTDGDPLDVRTQEGRTDLANSRRFVRLHGEIVRFCHSWNKWLVWDGCRWKLDDDGGLMRLAKSVADSVWGEARATGDPDALSFAAKTASDRSIKAFLSLAASDVSVKPDELDANGWLLNCPNGTLDLRTGELREHRREDLITKLCPTPFNADAASYEFDGFLEGIFDSDAELMGFVQRLFGYGLTASVVEQVLAIFHGGGANGKSTLLRALLDTLGSDYAMQAPPDLLMLKRGESHPTERADLHGKRLIVAMETESNRALAESLVKQLTGGDKIRARRMREDFWEFAPTFKLLLATNHRPRVKGTDFAIWRRLRLVPFNVKFEGPRADKSILEKLMSEREGILAWAVRGCLDWQSQGLTAPEAVTAATESYRADEDTIGRFLDESCTLRADAETRATDLYRRYVEWCDRLGEHAINGTRFGRALSERGFAKRKSNGVLWQGVALNS